MELSSSKGLQLIVMLVLRHYGFQYAKRLEDLWAYLLLRYKCQGYSISGIDTKVYLLNTGFHFFLAMKLILFAWYVSFATSS